MEYKVSISPTNNYAKRLAKKHNQLMGKKDITSKEAKERFLIKYRVKAKNVLTARKRAIKQYKKIYPTIRISSKVIKVK